MRPGPLLRIDLPSRYEQLDLVDAVLGTTLRELGLDEEFIDRLGLAVREAVANAILHGNRLQAEKRVGLEVSVAEGQMILRVRDQGEGFDPNEVPDPRQPDNLLKVSGRGLLLMRTLTDRVDFSFEAGEGTLVTLTKNLPPSGSGAEKEESQT